MFGVVPKTIWSGRLPPDDLNRVALAFNCYLIETGSHSILVETGGGKQFDSRARERMKMPMPVPSIAEYLDPLRIDIVINTHLHWDHCSGNMSDGKPTFPRAKYFVQRGEWEYAHTRNVRDAVSYIDSNYDPLVETGQMELLNGAAEILPGIEVSVAPGHNRDMMMVTAISQGKTFCLLADLVPTLEHLKPTWVAAFDLFPLTAIESKTNILSQAAREGWWCGFGHDTRVAFATVSDTFKILESLP